MGNEVNLKKAIQTIAIGIYIVIMASYIFTCMARFISYEWYFDYMVIINIVFIVLMIWLHLNSIKMSIYKSEKLDRLYGFWEKSIKPYQKRRLIILCILLFLTSYGTLLYTENLDNEWVNHPLRGTSGTVIVQIPIGTEFKWDSIRGYTDSEKGIQLSLKENQMIINKYIDEMDKDRDKVKEDFKGTGLPLGTKGWSDVDGWYHILIKNPKNSNIAIAIASKNKDTSIKIAKNVIFI